MKKIIISAMMIMSTKGLFAQRIFGSFASDIETEVKVIYPSIVGLVFLVSFLFNLDKFFGDKKDVKGGFTNMIIYVGGVTVGGAIYLYLKSISI